MTLMELARKLVDEQTLEGDEALEAQVAVMYESTRFAACVALAHLENGDVDEAIEVLEQVTEEVS